MFFLNLSAGEFFVLLGSLGGLIAALYLLDRSRRKKVVSTLRFWTPGGRVEQRRKRRHVLEPWSLLLQLASLTLLLLAIAQVQWGSRAGIGRDHVLLLDTSSASAGRVGAANRSEQREGSREKVFTAIEFSRPGDAGASGRSGYAGDFVYI